ncbi:hypothetical protein F511_23934 [Dorcoceras hygrometricum]|uniref:Dystroglycan-like n=1 Tax=Dorcoceras hygrometricum TaxID=472368 RepID=A0A2Z7AGX9_9LAMI|nr:hypothetical protein F511_23934 [Dorcoceras hygrometricum]
MASSFYTNTLHVDFESILAMDNPGMVSVFNAPLHVDFESILAMDNPDMVSVFNAIMASGLEGFLGCPTVLYEAALVDFFENGSVRDGLVFSTVNGVTVDITEQLFAEAFELPVDVSTSGKKSQMKIEYRLLSDIMAKTISVKAGSFNANTTEKFFMLTAIVCGVRINWTSVLFNIFKKMVTPGTKQAKGFAIQVSLVRENILNLELDESSEFPSSKILTERTIHRYIVLNDKVGAEEAADAPKVKKAPVQRAVSKKRPVAAAVGDPVLKKKRTMKKKSCSSQANLEIVAVSQEAVPIQIIEPIPAAPADDEMEEQPADEVAAENVEQPAAEAEITVEQPADEVVGETIVKEFDEPTVETTAEEIITTSFDDVYIIIKQVIADTAQMGPDADDHGVGAPDVEDQTAGTTVGDTDEEMETIKAGTGVGDQQLQSFVAADSRTDAAADYFVEELEEVEIQFECLGLHFRVENRIWSISGNFEIFEILVKSSNRFDDVSVVGMSCDADVNIAGLRDLSVKSVSGFDDVSISWLLSVDDIWLRSVQRAFYGAAPFSERGRRDLFCLVGVRKFRPDDVSISVVFRATRIANSFGDSTRSVLGKCVYLFTLTMSLFDLQDVCIAIGSLATLDLPMVVDMIGIYGLKVPYCTLTRTNWFLQALSVIPRGSWGDVARRSYHDPMDKSGISYDEVTVMGMNRMFIRWTQARWAGPSPSLSLLKPPCAAAVVAASLAGICFGQLDEENPSAPISSGLLVQADEGVSLPVYAIGSKAGRREDACRCARRALVARWLRDARAMRCGGGAHLFAPRLMSLVAAAAGRSPLRRVPGDVVTAGLNSSRVWFGPVPGSLITAIKMVSMKNPLAAILDSNRFTGLNYQDWIRNLNLVLASEKLLYTIEKSPPEETPACISPEELITLNQWRDDELGVRSTQLRIIRLNYGIQRRSTQIRVQKPDRELTGKRNQIASYPEKETGSRAGLRMKPAPKRAE